LSDKKALREHVGPQSGLSDKNKKIYDHSAFLLDTTRLEEQVEFLMDIKVYLNLNKIKRLLKMPGFEDLLSWFTENKGLEKIIKTSQLAKCREKQLRVLHNLQ